MRLLPFVFIKELIYVAPEHFEYLNIPPSIEVVDITLDDLNRFIISKSELDYCKFRVKKGYKGICLVNNKS